MYHDNTQPYKAVYIPVLGTPEYLFADLSSVFSFSRVSLDSLMFAPMNDKVCMCIDSTYKKTQENVNLLATQIYRDSFHVYSISDVIYGPALVFSYYKDQIQNTEHLLSITDSYIEEVTNRYLINEKISLYPPKTTS